MGEVDTYILSIGTLTDAGVGCRTQGQLRVEPKRSDPNRLTPRAQMSLEYAVNEMVDLYTFGISPMVQQR